MDNSLVIYRNAAEMVLKSLTANPPISLSSLKDDYPNGQIVHGLASGYMARGFIEAYEKEGADTAAIGQLTIAAEMVYNLHDEFNDTVKETDLFKRGIARQRLLLGLLEYGGRIFGEECTSQQRWEGLELLLLLAAPLMPLDWLDVVMVVIKTQKYHEERA